MKVLLRCLLPLSLLLAAPVHANLTVHPMRASVDANKGTHIRVYSQSTRPQYVQASLRQIVDPAGAGEQEIDIEPSEAALAITPGKFALSGGGNRLIRLIPLQPVQVETAYRVYFEGVAGPEQAPVAGLADNAQAQVGVSLVWGALVNVLPSDGKVDMQLRGATLLNTGTLRLGITRIADCTAAGACIEHEVSRSLYPGAELTLPFEPVAGNKLQLRYRLSRDGYREHVQNLVAAD